MLNALALKLTSGVIFRRGLQKSIGWLQGSIWLGWKKNKLLHLPGIETSLTSLYSTLYKN